MLDTPSAVLDTPVSNFILNHAGLFESWKAKVEDAVVQYLKSPILAEESHLETLKFIN